LAQRFLPIVVLGLVAGLVLVIALWSIDHYRLTRGSTAYSAQQATGEGLPETTAIEWKLVTTWPKNLPGLGSAPENFARYVNAMSNGRLSVKVFGAGEIVPAFGVFDAVSQGVAQAGHGAAYYWKGKIPRRGFFYGYTLWYDGSRDERLAPLRWRIGTLARVVSALQCDSFCRRQYWRPDGRVV